MAKPCAHPFSAHHLPVKNGQNTEVLGWDAHRPIPTSRPQFLHVEWGVWRGSTELGLAHSYTITNSYGWLRTLGRRHSPVSTLCHPFSCPPCGGEEGVTQPGS